MNFFFLTTMFLLQAIGDACEDGSYISFLNHASRVDELGFLSLVFEHRLNISVDIVFSDPTCGLALQTPSPSSWTTSLAPNGCVQQILGVPLTEALSSCGFRIASSSTDRAVAISSPKVITHQNVIIAGHNVTNTASYFVQIALQLETTLVSTRSSIEVDFGIVIDCGIASSVFDLSTEQMTITFATSSIAPYALDGDAITHTDVPDWVLHTLSSSNGSLACPENEDCFQYWTLIVNRTMSCDAKSPQYLEADFFLPFKVNCREYYVEDCGAPSDVIINCNTRFDDYCTRVIGEVPLEGSVSMFLEPEGINQLDSYLYATRAHAVATVASVAKIEHIHITSVVLSDESTFVLTLYDDPHASINDFSMEADNANYHSFDIEPSVLLIVENDRNVMNHTVRTRASWTWSAVTAPASVNGGVSDITVTMTLLVLLLDTDGVRRLRSLTMKANNYPVFQPANTNLHSKVGVSRTFRALIEVGYKPDSRVLVGLEVPRYSPNPMTTIKRDTKAPITENDSYVPAVTIWSVTGGGIILIGGILRFRGVCTECVPSHSPVHSMSVHTGISV
jgi:hypothetical protein